MEAGCPVELALRHLAFVDHRQTTAAARHGRFDVLRRLLMARHESTGSSAAARQLPAGSTRLDATRCFALASPADEEVFCVVRVR